VTRFIQKLTGAAAFNGFAAGAKAVKQIGIIGNNMFPIMPEPDEPVA
jgi:hypothetical protein